MAAAALWLGLAWGALVVAALWPRRPRPTLRVPAPAIGPRTGPLTRLGAAVRRAAGLPADPDGARGLGGGLVVAVTLVPVAPVLVPVALAGAVLVPHLARRRAERRAAAAAADALPDAVDLLALALASGLTVPLALGVVARRIPAPLGPDLVEAEVRSRHGEPLVESLDRAAASQPVARPLLRLLVAAHRDGSPVVEPLARLADEQRVARRRVAEAQARQVPVRLLFPLVCCTLPAFALLTVVPPVIVALGDLQG